MRSRRITVDAEVWTDEVIGLIDLDDLIEYVKDKGYKVYKEEKYAPIPSPSTNMFGEYFPPLKRIGYTKDELYRHLCDILRLWLLRVKELFVEQT